MDTYNTKQMTVDVPMSISRKGGWVACGTHCVFTWVAMPHDVTMRTDKAIILCPPLGHEATHAYRSYRQLSERLVALGLCVVRMEYPGTGNSAGHCAQGELANNFIESCIQTVEAIREHLRGLGYTNIGLYGARFGGSIAALCAQKNEYDFGVLWAPIERGRRYVRELKAISLTSAQSGISQPKNSTFEAAGFPYSNATIEFLNNYQLNIGDLNNFKKLLVIENAITPMLKIPHADIEAIEELDAILAEPHNTRLPTHVFNAIARWLLKIPASLHKTANDLSFVSTKIQHSNTSYGESVLDASQPYFGICTYRNANHINKPAPKKILVLINAGSVYNAGPNRLYVNMARALASDELCVVRVDISQLGDSVCKDLEDENHPYAKNSINDVKAICHSLKALYPNAKVWAAGVCSGGYHALHAAFLQTKSVELKGAARIIDRVLVINPLTFAWNTSLSLEVPKRVDVNSETMHYKTKIVSAHAWKKFITGKVSYVHLVKFIAQYSLAKIYLSLTKLLERTGLQPATVLAKQLKALVGDGVKVHMVFASTDPGYLLLKKEGGAAVSRMIRKNKLTVNIVHNADHTFSSAMATKRLVEVVKVMTDGK